MQRDGITKAELARRIGKSRAFVTQLLRGSRNMTVRTLADLAFALGARVELRSASVLRRASAVVKDQPASWGRERGTLVLRTHTRWHLGKGDAISLLDVGYRQLGGTRLPTDIKQPDWIAA